MLFAIHQLIPSAGIEPEIMGSRTLSRPHSYFIKTSDILRNFKFFGKYGPEMSSGRPIFHLSLAAKYYRKVVHVTFCADFW
jgi:hypothetical protein